MSTPSKRATTAPRTPHTHELSFPPFPPVPKGVTLIPFKDFKEYGIQPFLNDDEIERDGLGIPTIALRVTHDTDLSKTDLSRVPMGSGMKQTAPTNGFGRKEWWEDWEEGEDLRIHGPYDPNVAQVDRFHQAASDFQKYRKFPPASTNVKYLWDQFRLFAGLLSTTPVWQNNSGKSASDGDLENLSDDEDDFDRASTSVDQTQSSFQQHDGHKRKRLRPRAPYDIYGKSPTLVENNDETQELLSQARAAKEDKVVEFLNDPAKGVRVFLSSYMIYQGWVYTDKNLTNAPRLLGFFIHYLLRARVFPDDRHMEWNLRSALTVVKKAGRQLPLTAVLARGLADDFGRGCVGVWGARGDRGVEVDGDLIGGRGGEGGDVDDGAVDGHVHPSSLSSPTNAAAPTIDENAPKLFVVSPSDPSSSSWGLETDDLADAADDWSAPTRPSLLALFGGPTALPLTHTPGVVEWSVRRVKTVSMPTPPAKFDQDAPSTDTGSGEQGEAGVGPDAEAVERAMEGRFARVVMEPWVGWDIAGSEEGTQAARILRSSVGEVVISSSSATPPAGIGGLKPHNLLADDITVLLDPGVARDLCDGMGIGGTWVQLARVGDMPNMGPANGEKDGETQSKSKKKKVLKKAQKERRGLRYWY
ncbi:hypothetical protein R3P38DRAFT_3434366, partial [Favolaschia claudopus]